MYRSAKWAPRNTVVWGTAKYKILALEKRIYTDWLNPFGSAVEITTDAYYYGIIVAIPIATKRLKPRQSPR